MYHVDANAFSAYLQRYAKPDCETIYCTVMDTIYRAQGILRRWKEEEAKDTSTSKVAPLLYLIDHEYHQYLNICFWCHEKPLTKGKWLLQKIEVQ